MCQHIPLQNWHARSPCCWLYWMLTTHSWVLLPELLSAKSHPFPRSSHHLMPGESSKASPHCRSLKQLWKGTQLQDSQWDWLRPLLQLHHSPTSPHPTLLAGIDPESLPNKLSGHKYPPQILFPREFILRQRGKQTVDRSLEIIRETGNKSHVVADTKSQKNHAAIRSYG